MNKKILTSLAGLLLGANLLADGYVTDFLKNSDDGLFVGGTLGGGSGQVSLSTDTSSYTFSDSSISTSDTKLYAGIGNYYLFYQTGTIKTGTSSLSDYGYNAFGIGGYGKMESSKMDFKAFSLTPEYDLEVGFDSLSGNDRWISSNASGFLISVDVGLALQIAHIENLSFTADIGYDLHAIKSSLSSTNYYGSSATWNFTSLNMNFGARYGF